MTYSQKAFTVIEMLVVLAVISLLSAACILAFGNARKKAMEAKVITSLSEIRGAATIILHDNNSYSNLCSQTPCASCSSGHCNLNETNYASLKMIQDDIEKYTDAPKCYCSSEAYCIETIFDNVNYCTDSVGTLQTGVLCDSSAVSCQTTVDKGKEKKPKK